MIFRIDSSLKDMTAEPARKKELADFILHVCKGRHNLCCLPEVWKWLEEQVLIAPYLAEWDRELLRKNRQLREITQMKRSYLSTVTVGYADGMCAPSDTDKWMGQPSLVIVENERNDWAVIRRWIDLLKNDRTYKDVNTLVCQRKDEARELSAYHAGSCGQIVPVILQRKAAYGVGLPYKVTVVVDSDKTSPTDEWSHEKHHILEVMEAEGIEGHILQKREMENYFPVETFRAAGMVDPRVEIPEIPPEVWDFMDLEHQPFIRYQKRQLPELTEYLDRPSLLGRVAHSPCTYKGETMNEIQMIILKLAKLC
jgi:hypothetical protein